MNVNKKVFKTRRLLVPCAVCGITVSLIILYSMSFNMKTFSFLTEYVSEESYKTPFVRKEKFSMKGYLETTKLNGKVHDHLSDSLRSVYSEQNTIFPFNGTSETRDRNTSRNKIQMGLNKTVHSGNIQHWKTTQATLRSWEDNSGLAVSERQHGTPGENVKGADLYKPSSTKINTKNGTHTEKLYVSDHTNVNNRKMVNFTQNIEKKSGLNQTVMRLTRQGSPASNFTRTGIGKSVLKNGDLVVKSNIFHGEGKSFGEEQRVDVYTDTTHRQRLPVSTCPSVLDLMLKGRWEQQPMTVQERLERKAYYIGTRIVKGLPVNFQRADGRCGNVPFLPPNEKWRALCDPFGSTPCCYDNVCSAKTLTQCTCPRCYDMRTLIHAEYSTWIPADARCQPLSLSVDEVCQLLEGYTLYFVGDSLMRHFFAAFLMVVRGDELHGALVPTVDEDVKNRCHGQDMFPYGTECSKWLDRNATLCNGTVNVMFHGHYQHRAETTGEIVQTLSSLQKQQKNLAILGFGIHYQLKTKNVMDNIILPVFKNLSWVNIHYPKLLWVSNHAPGILKSPKYPGQMSPFVIKFNAEMKYIFDAIHVPVMDTFNMTSQGIMSHDGTHYGIAVNRLKANFLLNYLLELRAKKEW